MNGLIEAARQAGHQAVRLTVAADLEPASALYRGLGFAQVGLAPGYYQPSGRDGVIMRLALTRSRLALTRSPQ
jgi:ribosomal-protein-alanine N-acetyltransferase